MNKPGMLITSFECKSRVQEQRPRLKSQKGDKKGGVKLESFTERVLEHNRSTMRGREGGHLILGRIDADTKGNKSVYRGKDTSLPSGSLADDNKRKLRGRLEI